MILLVPKYFNSGSGIDSFIIQASSCFGKCNTREPDFILDVTKIKKISLLGQLLLYKYVSFTVEHNCFLSPKIKGLESKKLQEKLKESGFYYLIKTYIFFPGDKNALTKSYNQLKISTTQDGVLIAPQKLLRESLHERQQRENQYLSAVFDYYSNFGNKGSTIGFCIAELLSNFWAHATEDTGTIMVVKGSRHSIEICFADTGDGIINDLRKSSEAFNTLSDKELLLKALEKSVTSKPNTNHAGLGLYLIKTIVLHSKDSVLHIICNSVSYKLWGGERQKISLSGFWKGTITYLRFDVNNITSMDSIKELRGDLYDRIKWG